MHRVALLALLAGCSGGDHHAPPPVAPAPRPIAPAAPAPPPEAKPAPPPIVLRELKQLPGDVSLVSGDQHTVLVDADANWHDIGANGVLSADPIGDAVNAKCTGNGIADIMIGSTVIARCGRKTYRFRTTGPVEELTPPGPLEQIGVGHDKTEVYRYRDRGVVRLLAWGKHAFIRLPDIERLAQVTDERPACANPSVIDLASNGEVVVGLVTECNPDAAVRVVEIKWPGPTQTVKVLDPPATLGLRPAYITMDDSGAITLVGIANGRLALKRLDGDVKLGPPAREVEAVISAKGDGVWVVSSNGSKLATTLTRDLVPVSLPDGVQVQDVSADNDVGVIVKAIGNGAHWLFVHH